jgi:uncharacterized membrane protein YidH (DUF202 family)
MAHIKNLTGLTLFFFLPFLAYAQDTRWLDSLGSGLGDILSSLAVTLIACAVAVFVWGMVVFIAKAGDEKARTEGKRRMVWGIVSIFVIVSLWGLVALIQSITGLTPGAVVAPRSTL